MKLSIVAIGKMGRDEEAALAMHYIKHARNLSRPSGLWTEIESVDTAESRAQTVELRQADEAIQLGTMAKDAVRVALDPRGADMSSAEFMAFIARQRTLGTRNLAFIIGGPDGFSPEFRATCAHSIRFGAQTWPHRLVRVMLAEQLFRAATLAAGVPYSR